MGSRRDRLTGSVLIWLFAVCVILIPVVVEGAPHPAFGMARVPRNAKMPPVCASEYVHVRDSRMNIEDAISAPVPSTFLFRNGLKELIVYCRRSGSREQESATQRRHSGIVKRPLRKCRTADLGEVEIGAHANSWTSSTVFYDYRSGWGISNFYAGIYLQRFNTYPSPLFVARDCNTSIKSGLGFVLHFYSWLLCSVQDSAPWRVVLCCSAINRSICCLVLSPLDFISPRVEAAVPEALVAASALCLVRTTYRHNSKSEATLVTKRNPVNMTNHLLNRSCLRLYPLWYSFSSACCRSTSRSRVSMTRPGSRYGGCLSRRCSSLGPTVFDISY
jgi:hypothetical protein